MQYAIVPHFTRPPLEYVGSREDFDSTCSNTSGYSSSVTDMSATAAGAVGGGKGDKEAGGESRAIVDMTEEIAFTPPDGGLRVSKRSPKPCIKTTLIVTLMVPLLALDHVL